MDKVPVQDFGFETIGRRGKVVNDNDVNCLFNTNLSNKDYYNIDKDKYYIIVNFDIYKYVNNINYIYKYIYDLIFRQ